MGDEAGAVPSCGASGGSLRGLRGNHYLDRPSWLNESTHLRTEPVDYCQRQEYNILGNQEQRNVETKNFP